MSKLDRNVRRIAREVFGQLGSEKFLVPMEEYNRRVREVRAVMDEQRLVWYDDSVKLVEEKDPICTDHDSDCHGVCDKVACWLHDPSRGPCPYLDPSVLDK